jgi:predicted membrane-bound mannosyltransferase
MAICILLPLAIPAALFVANRLRWRRAVMRCPECHEGSRRSRARPVTGAARSTAATTTYPPATRTGATVSSAR